MHIQCFTIWKPGATQIKLYTIAIIAIVMKAQ